MKRTALLFVLGLCLSACGPAVSVTPLGARLAPTSEPVQVFTSAQAVGQPYREVALISIERASVLMSDSDLLDLMMERAQEAGAQGVILLGQETRSAGGAIIPNGFGGASYIPSSEKVMRGSGIIFLNSQVTANASVDEPQRAQVESTPQYDEHGNRYLEPWDGEE